MKINSLLAKTPPATRMRSKGAWVFDVYVFFFFVESWKDARTGAKIRETTNVVVNQFSIQLLLFDITSQQELSQLFTLE